MSGAASIRTSGMGQTKIDGVSISTEDFQVQDNLNLNLHLHITKFIPDNRSNLSPIVGSGGVNHPTELYKRFLIKLLLVLLFKHGKANKFT